MKEQDYNYWVNRKPEDPHPDWVHDGPWLEGYEKSVDHPHRRLILKHLKGMRSLLEVGCNCGPNLLNIHNKYPLMELTGVDANQNAINRAKELVPTANLSQGDFASLDMDGKTFDVVLADAVLMYINPDQIVKVMDDLCWMADEKIIIIDRFANSRLGVSNGYIWYRNYPQLLQEHGFTVTKTKLTAETWPHSNGWKTAGYVFVGIRP